MDKLAPLVSTPNEFYLVEQFTKPNQAENAATNLRRPNANKPPLPEGWSWEFSSASFPDGHSSLYAKVVAPDVKIEPTTPVVREEREVTRVTVPPSAQYTASHPADEPVVVEEGDGEVTTDLLQIVSDDATEPPVATIDVGPVEVGTIPVDTMTVTDLPEPDWESLKAENDRVPTTDELAEALAAVPDDEAGDIPF